MHHVQLSRITKEWINHVQNNYDQTIAELKKYEPFVKRGGIITLHDIVSYPEVFSAIKEFIKNREDIKFYKYFHNHGLGVLIKK